MFPEEMVGLLLGLSHTKGSRDGFRNAHERLINVVEPDGPRMMTVEDGRTEVNSGGERGIPRNPINIKTMTDEGISAADQAARD